MQMHVTGRQLCFAPSHGLRQSGLRLVVVALVVVLAAACSASSSGSDATKESAGGSTPSPSASGEQSASPSASTSPPACPNPEGQACLGSLTAGEYTTKQFEPAISYTVPGGGWANFEDSPGTFLLVPPGYTLQGVNPGTSDYIAAYVSVGPAASCDADKVDGSVLPTPAGFKTWLRQHRDRYQISHLHPVTVGGLSGFVVDLRMARSWHKTCPWSNGQRIAPLITGMGQSSGDHVLIPGLAIRLYLLNYLQGALAIEVDDVTDANHLGAYSKVVQQMKFAT
jgi:hypothetical protein